MKLQLSQSNNPSELHLSLRTERERRVRLFRALLVRVCVCVVYFKKSFLHVGKRKRLSYVLFFGISHETMFLFFLCAS